MPLVVAGEEVRVRLVVRASGPTSHGGETLRLAPVWKIQPRTVVRFGSTTNRDPSRVCYVTTLRPSGKQVVQCNLAKGGISFNHRSDQSVYVWLHPVNTTVGFLNMTFTFLAKEFAQSLVPEILVHGVFWRVETAILPRRSGKQVLVRVRA